MRELTSVLLELLLGGAGESVPTTDGSDGGGGENERLRVGIEGGAMGGGGRLVCGTHSGRRYGGEGQNLTPDVGGIVELWGESGLVLGYVTTAGDALSDNVRTVGGKDDEVLYGATKTRVAGQQIRTLIALAVAATTGNTT